VNGEASVKQQLRKTRKRIHPIYIPYLPTYCTGPKIYATMAVCIMNSSFSKSHSGRITISNSRFAKLSILSQDKLKPMVIPTLSLSCPM
jgi:hypothetical protein